MEKVQLTVDLLLFERQFELFRKLVIEKSGGDIVSFNANPYTEKEEGYKYTIHNSARKIIDFGSWSEHEIGKKRIIKSVIDAVEIKGNNLVQWQPRFGNNARQHQALHTVLTNTDKVKVYERILFNLYRGNEDELSFAHLTEIFGNKYPIIAYLFFIKDRTRYLPIAPSYFDKAFQYLDINFVTSHKCSWDNYQTYNNILRDIRNLLEGKLKSEVSLLDAHSFMWMLATKLAESSNSEKEKYLGLSGKERDALIKARVGQGRFRDAVIGYWSSCAVTGCEQRDLLIASHIKPWAACDSNEAVDPYNGLLLSPSLDVAFDAGYITFTDEGKIIVSSWLRDTDALALGINDSLYLRKIDPKHIPYLKYHRINIYEKFKR